MDEIRQEGKTVEEAIKLALEKLEIEEDKAEIKVLDEGSKALLGIFGGKNAVVEVKVKIDPVELGLEFLKNLFDNMPVSVELELIEEETNDEQVMYNIKGSDLGIIIGHRGETLDAVQYLTSLAVNKKTESYYRVLIDAEGYRKRRQNTLQRLARRLAQKAISTGRKVMLEPMPPHERRIIHMTLRPDQRINTYSEGREPFRKVMIEKAEG
ncbi:RNA-binding cell elongation regulator Jag/EloR [Natronospora cellulosivora (SeqCode)]